jgi:hypothetical protein
MMNAWRQSQIKPTFYSENMKTGSQLQGLNVEGMIILKQINRI